ncbi:hypothetical protein R1sor_025152 [Riccia sorocarpa]|uniref:Uncharacterized protein n=1 Tax=Riccia sorocarpa TaxID=122646 RepID=A0ABD3GBN6_9MARC
MTDSFEQSGGRRGPEMAVNVSKQIDYGGSKDEGEYWHDMHNELSPVRKHLIQTYLQIQDEDALPLLGEYFGVALSFMAMGALVRASNSSKRRRKSMSEEDCMDLRACSRFQRMALESMLREAMERLKGLAQNAYHLEERVRDLLEAEEEKDNEKGILLSRIAEAERAVHELKSLRKAEGKANERVMSIVAAKEQDWLKEKRSLQKEIERLKENLNTVCREVKFQSRRCRNPTCEHCKGIERVVRNVRGRASLRELNSREASVHVAPRREMVKVEQPPDVEEVEEERVLVKALEQKKKRVERPGHLQVQDKVERHEKPGNWTGSRGSINPSGGSAGGAGQFMTKELIAKQQLDMETELANILKRVGMLKQRSHISSLAQNATLERKNDGLSFNRASTSGSKDSAVVMDPRGDEAFADSTKSPAVVKRQAKNRSTSSSELELADDLPSGLLTLEQEALLSGEEDPELLELEKAFELEIGLGSPEVAEKSRVQTHSLRDMIAEEKELSADGEAEFAEFESHLSSDDKGTESEEAESAATAVPDSCSNVPSVDVSEPVAELPFLVAESSIATHQGLELPESLEQSTSSVDAVSDNEVRAESAVIEDDCNEPVTEEGVNSVREDKPLAEEVKVIDREHLPESEQVLEIVEVDRSMELPERTDTPVEDVQSVESSSSEAESNGRADETVSGVDKSDQDAEIPVFERLGSDPVGDLPEPDEKRVCDSSESEIEIVEDDPTFLKCGEVANTKGDDLGLPGDGLSPMVSDTIVDAVELSPPVEKVETAGDTGFSSEQVKPLKVEEEVGSAGSA